MKVKCSSKDSRTTSSTSSTISMAAINNIIERLKYNQHQDSTRSNYYGIWKQFAEFYSRLDEKPVEWEDKITLFVAYLINDNKKSVTVCSYVSALCAVLKVDGIVLSPNSILLSALTRVCKRVNDTI